MAEANCRARGTHGIFIYARYPRESRHVSFTQCTARHFILRGRTQHIFLGTAHRAAFYFAWGHTAYFFRHCTRASHGTFRLGTVPARITVHFSMHSVPRGIFFGAGNTRHILSNTLHQRAHTAYLFMHATSASYVTFFYATSRPSSPYASEQAITFMPVPRIS